MGLTIPDPWVSHEIPDILNRMKEEDKKNLEVVCDDEDYTIHSIIKKYFMDGIQASPLCGYTLSEEDCNVTGKCTIENFLNKSKYNYNRIIIIDGSKDNVLLNKELSDINSENFPDELRDKVITNIYLDKDDNIELNIGEVIKNGIPNNA